MPASPSVLLYLSLLSAAKNLHERSWKKRILRRVYPERNARILRFAQDDERRDQNTVVRSGSILTVITDEALLRPHGRQTSQARWIEHSAQTSPSHCNRENHLGKKAQERWR